jgi:hypothetical protein
VPAMRDHHDGRPSQGFERPHAVFVHRDHAVQDELPLRGTHDRHVARHGKPERARDLPQIFR